MARAAAVAQMEALPDACYCGSAAPLLWAISAPPGIERRLR